jgi:4-hydroxy-3-polyprenylbenzoate decarboxylase
MNLTIAITGASGAVFGREMLRVLEADERVARVHFVASENSLRVMAEELGLSGRTGLLEKLRGAETGKTEPKMASETDLKKAPAMEPKKPLANSKIVQHANSDIGAAIASGSYPSNGMIVLPCSMGTLAAIANGLANSLIARAADVTLKERRPLVLCVREAPFNRIHLRNMTLAAEAGATIFPCIPAFYNHPVDTTEMARQFVYRVLGHIGLPQAGAYVWKADNSNGDQAGSGRADLETEG